MGGRGQSFNRSIRRFDHRQGVPAGSHRCLLFIAPGLRRGPSRLCPDRASMRASPGDGAGGAGLCSTPGCLRATCSSRGVRTSSLRSSSALSWPAASWSKYSGTDWLVGSRETIATLEIHGRRRRFGGLFAFTDRSGRTDRPSANGRETPHSEGPNDIVRSRCCSNECAIKQIRENGEISKKRRCQRCRQ